ncbi:hypothetical protein Leryth_011733 [Lithospermum erythrorhizon]|nr:hypothetical protein Leryth_011733 [Lithospermum erythrorhizon]
MDKKKGATPLICHGHSRPVVDLFYSPITQDGFFLISGSKDSNPMLRNGETGDWIGTFLGHKGAVWSSCLDKNALRAATASADFSAKLWDALSGDELHSFAHKHIVRACAFSEDTKLLLTGGMEKILRIYDLNRADAPPRELENTPSSVRTVAWLHSDQTILSSCTDLSGVRLWDVRSGKIVRTLETKSPVTSAEVSQDGRFITTADGSILPVLLYVQFLNSFGVVKSYEMPCNIESASLEPKHGNKFVAGGEDMWVHILLKSEELFTSALLGIYIPIYNEGNYSSFEFVMYTTLVSARFLPFGLCFVIYSCGQLIWRGCNKGHHGPVHCLRFAPGGESYASGSEDGTIRIWQSNPVDHHQEPDASVASEPTRDMKDATDAVANKIVDLQIAKQGETSESVGVKASETLEANLVASEN